MSGNLSPADAAGRRLPRAAALATLGTLLLSLWCSAEPLRGTQGATGRFNVTIVVPPVFKVLQVRPVKAGHEYRVWTNLPSVLIKGREYRFDKVGEATFTVAGSGEGPEIAVWSGAVAALAAATTTGASAGGGPAAAAAPAVDDSGTVRVTVSY